MSNYKRLAVNLSETLNQDLIKALKEDCLKDEDDPLKEAVVVYIEEKRKRKLIEQMKKGYLEMATINMELSELGFVSDMKDLIEYEARLAESDLPNDHDSEKRRYILC